MIRKTTALFKVILGLDHANLIVIMSIRGIILYVLAMLFIRSNKKFLGIRTSSNFILFVMLGSMSAAAVSQEGLFLPIVSTIIILGIINKIIAMLFFYYPWIEDFFAGKPVMLINNGEIQWPNMKANFITRNDLVSALQTQLHTEDFSKIDSAYLATDGTINFIVKS